jgi:hypothetical protein
MKDSLSTENNQNKNKNNWIASRKCFLYNHMARLHTLFLRGVEIM